MNKPSMSKCSTFCDQGNRPITDCPFVEVEGSSRISSYEPSIESYRSVCSECGCICMASRNVMPITKPEPLKESNDDT